VTGIVVPPSWKSLAIENLQGTVMIIGASDSGKSTVARYLYQELCRHGVRVAYLDADVGQSTLGLPTTLNAILANEPGDGRFPPEGAHASYFVGSTTPRGHMLPCVIGAFRLQQWALAMGANAVVVDTTGLVDKAQGGKALKQWKIELLAPDVVIGLYREQELEPILWPLRRDGRVRCIELPASPHALARPRESRIARRRERLAGYFEGAQPRLVNLGQLAVYELQRLAHGALVAFQDAQGFALGLGAVQEIDRLAGTVIVCTPLAELKEVASVRFGATRWDLANKRDF
jgi:polynucleotide 5'-hydroxyl-kinase GRC3/NOL9